MQIQATQMKVGSVILYNTQPHVVSWLQHHTPGNLRGMVQTKLKNLKTGKSTEHRFRSEDSVEKAELDQQQVEFLYADGDLYYFMNTENYEQFPLTKEVLGDAVHFLLPNTPCQILFFEGQPVTVDPPTVVVLTVTDTTPFIKGATISGTKKPATCETGLTVLVPQFVEVGTRIKVDTREGGSYLDRA